MIQTFLLGLRNKQNLVPALIESIKVAGLVLVIDTSEEKSPSSRNTTTAAVPSSTSSVSISTIGQQQQQQQQSLYRMPDGVDGILKGNGVLRFHDTIDM